MWCFSAHSRNAIVHIWTNNLPPSLVAVQHLFGSERNEKREADRIATGGFPRIFLKKNIRKMVHLWYFKNSAHFWQPWSNRTSLDLHLLIVRFALPSKLPYTVRSVRYRIAAYHKNVPNHRPGCKIELTTQAYHSRELKTKQRRASSWDRAPLDNRVIAVFYREFDHQRCLP